MEEVWTGVLEMFSRAKRRFGLVVMMDMLIVGK